MHTSQLQVPGLILPILQYVDVGCNGRISDGGVFKNSSLFAALEANSLNIPQPSPLPGGSSPIPYHLVADDAFPLKEYIMKPYSQTGLTPENAFSTTG